MISFYVEDEGNRYYWTGKRFSEYEHDAMTYKLNKPRSFIIENLHRLPQVKQMMEIDSSLTLSDIKVE